MGIKIYRRKKMEISEINEKAKERLKRVNGQINGIYKMIEEGRYCVDVLTQIAAADSALKEVRNLILKRHMNTCVAESLKSKSREKKQEKIDEIVMLFSKFGK